MRGMGGRACGESARQLGAVLVGVFSRHTMCAYNVQFVDRFREMKRSVNARWGCMPTVSEAHRDPGRSLEGRLDLNCLVDSSSVSQGSSISDAAAQWRRRSRTTSRVRRSQGRLTVPGTWLMGRECRTRAAGTAAGLHFAPPPAYARFFAAHSDRSRSILQFWLASSSGT